MIIVNGTGDHGVVVMGISRGVVPHRDGGDALFVFAIRWFQTRLANPT